MILNLILHQLTMRNIVDNCKYRLAQGRKQELRIETNDFILQCSSVFFELQIYKKF